MGIQGTRSEFPGCCGAEILHGLAAVEGNSTTRVASLRFATTNRHQLMEAEALKEAGFAPVLTWRNGNTGNTLTLWAQGTFTPLLKEKKAAVKKTGTHKRRAADDEIGMLD